MINFRSIGPRTRSIVICAVVLAAAAGCAGVNGNSAERDAALARLAAPHAAPDELGRRMYGMKHAISDEQLAELREAKAFGGANDDQIKRLMGLMGSNYSWYASDPALRGKEGVLVLSHGLGVQGDQKLRASIQASDIEQPVALAFGMSMMTSKHIQLAVDELVAAGAERIVVVPVLSTYHNSLMRQWDYIFGRREQPEYARVARVSGTVSVNLVSALNDHPLVGAIVADHAREVSYEPAKEEVIIVGHGPVDPADNLDQLAMMENIADVVRRDRDYAAVHVATMQDDAPRDVRMANFMMLRQRIQNAENEGRKMIVVTNLLGNRIVQSSLRRGLSGMGYRFNFKGLLEHEDFIVWIEESVADGLASLRP